METGAVRFTKVEGAGNDYVLVDGSLSAPERWSIALSDRHTGVGSDGLLLVGPGEGGADASMRIFNADGSEGRMCGNGLRCVVRYLVERKGLPDDRELVIATASGPRRGRRQADGRVEVAMGVPSFEPSDLPLRAEADERGFATVSVPAALGADPPLAWAVSTGNPHLVVRFGAVEPIDLESLGLALGTEAEHLPEGANVHALAVQSPDHLTVRPFERGSGATRACGTGAVACAAVSRSLGWIQAECIRVSMPGGDLSVRWPGSGEAWLGGPARLVFDGEWSSP